MAEGLGAEKAVGHRVLPKKSWDNERPPIEYFHELQRVSQNQIVWGGNYFADRLPVSRCWLYWQKLMGGDFSDGELAWTSFDKVVKEFTYCNKYHGKIHPTQKPNPSPCTNGSYPTTPSPRRQHTRYAHWFASSLIACPRHKWGLMR